MKHEGQQVHPVWSAPLSPSGWICVWLTPPCWRGVLLRRHMQLTSLLMQHSSKQHLRAGCAAYMQCGSQVSCCAAAMHPQDSSTGAGLGMFAKSWRTQQTMFGCQAWLAAVWLLLARSIPSWCVAPKAGVWSSVAPWCVL